MKMIDTEYVQAKIDQLNLLPILRDNLATLKRDFERSFENALNIDQAEEVPEAHLASMKTDLFVAFCHGARIAVDPQSAFRTNFNLPKEIQDEIARAKILMPDNEIKTPKKLIL